MASTGPLDNLRILEFAGLGPGPFCGMLLADLGADVVVVDRHGGNDILGQAHDVLRRGKRSVVLDLKSTADARVALALVEKADALIEGYRPGVMERLGLGPEVCLERNPRLVYGRMTGWGQTGPLAQRAGHDINYIAITGALHAIGTRAGGPTPPLNLVGDFGGGGMYLAVGILAALIEARASGRGQVVDAAISDGVIHLMSAIYGLLHNGRWSDRRQANLLDGGAHFYGVYRCGDGEWISVGAIEPKFYRLLLEKAGIDDPDFDGQDDAAQWASLRERLAALFRRKTRAQWRALMESADACFAPVLSLNEVPRHPHNRARDAFTEAHGVLQPNVAPRFDRTPGTIRRPPPGIGEHHREVLDDWGVARE